MKRDSFFESFYYFLCDIPGGGLPEDLGGGVRRASGNPYPTSDQDMWFSLPYFRPDLKFDTLFQTRP